jgi:hypothetical protein
VNEIKDLSDTLESLDCIEDKTFLWFFGSLVYKPTGEKVIKGFRYFTCEINQVAEAVASMDLEALAKLPFAIDEEGDVDTSSVLVDLAYTESGSFAAIQPVEYQDYKPTPVAPVTILEGEQAKPVAPKLKEIDQSS